MSDTNFDGKLQQTIGMMQNLTNLIAETEAQGLAHKDDGFTRELIETVKRSILNQNQANFMEALSNYENPPKNELIINGKKVELVDADILKKLKELLQVSELNLSLSKNDYNDAVIQTNFAKSQMVERDIIKNSLEENLNQLQGKISSIVSDVRIEGKSSLKQLEKNKELVKDSRDKNSTDRPVFTFTQDQNPYFKNNIHVTDFKKVSESNTTISSHMTIEAVDDR